MANLDLNPFFFERGEVGCLLIHGGTGSPPEMRGMGVSLAEQGFTALGICLPGHGTRPEDLSLVRWQDWAQAAREGLDRLRSTCSQIFVAGLSMGGLLSLHLAAREPLQGLVVMSTPPYMRDWRLPLLPMLKWFMKWYQQPPADLVDRSAETQLFYYRRIPIVFVLEFLELIESVRGELPLVSAPLLLMQGAHDHTIPPDSAQYICDRVSSQHKEYVLFPGSGHPITVDGEREEVWARAAGFIRQHAR